MKTYRKFSLLCASLVLSINTFAAPANYCNTINGFYKGTYVDTTGLFPNKPFPVKVYLTNQGNMIYGYTLRAGDNNGGGYGQAPYAAIWGTCENSQITNLYVIKNRNNPCGDPAPGPMTVNAGSPLNLVFNYENAMINANLNVTLSPLKNQNLNQSLLSQTEAMAKAGVQTCH